MIILPASSALVREPFSVPKKLRAARSRWMIGVVRKQWGQIRSLPCFLLGVSQQSNRLKEE